MCENVNSNPFAALFSPTNDATSLPSFDVPTDESAPTESSPREQDGPELPKRRKEPIDYLLKDIFGVITSNEIDEEFKECLVYVDGDSAEFAIFERLMLPDPKSQLIPENGGKGWRCDRHTLEKNIVPYLFESFARLKRYNRNSGNEALVNSLETITARNVATALQEPDVFSGQKVHEQFVTLFEEGPPDELASFLSGIIDEMGGANADEETITLAFSPVLDIVQRQAAEATNLSYRKYWFDLLQIFATLEPLGKLIIGHSRPKNSTGRAYSDTLLGALFSISCLPKHDHTDHFDFFSTPQEQASLTLEAFIGSALDNLGESLHLVFQSLLKCSSELRHRTLQWLGNCLEANASRGKLWSTQNEIVTAISSVSDGFMLNLGTVMLRLCQPFCGKSNESKILKIDPTYCAVQVEDEQEIRKRGVHLRRINNETCLVPASENETRLTAEYFGFVTECFFLTHRTLDLGYRVVHDKLLQVDQNLARLQSYNNDLSSSTSQMLITRMEKDMSKYLSLKTSLVETKMLNLLSMFHATTATWLVQVNLDVDEGNEENSVGRTIFSPRKMNKVTFPLPDRVPDTIKCIPEFIVENVIGFVCFLRRYAPNTFEEQGTNFLNPILTEIIALMESPKRLYNPHLRARFAEALEALLPTNEEGIRRTLSTLGSVQREKLFVNHRHKHQIVASLLQVFVSIEMTGQGVQFEQKFNYRRPMYIVMNYLWKLDSHRKNFKSLAEDAEKNMEAVQPPLFLRFINLLMNDAVFLLDEALTNMAQLKQMIQARENGEWDKLPANERQQQTVHFRHIGMMARFDNILGRETINTFKMLSTEIKSIFCHPTLVVRIASMLNYLLLQLVGPNNRNLKVKDQTEYEFNPATLVLNICEIYINLSNNENFTLAVSQDGRSYSSELFKLADDVLVRIGGGTIIGDLDNFAKRVEEAAHMKKEEDDVLNNAPDDFLDPIMSTLMLDPVILPSSKITVDRQTIARHLLSDQTDPFNRSPLTMDMIKSNTELRREIDEWIKQKRAEQTLKNENDS